MARLLSPTGWLVVALLVLAGLTLGYCAITRPVRDAAAKAEASATLSDGRTKAGQDASAVRDGNDAANTATLNDVKDAQDEVRHAPAADRDAVARRRLCQLNPGACAR
ncbi:hypothetical protein [Brevundimonas sp. FT23028]|uniref:hypothetical protein n=1 Tax=Brevundimonas sp. FT23028 TaxID=3393748 RepID=UPI003B586046